MEAKSGEKTSFTVACGLLSQLMRQKGNIANLNLGSNEVYRKPLTTMNLLPCVDLSSEQTEEKESRELENGSGLVSDSKEKENHEMELFPRIAGFSDGKVHDVLKESNGAPMTIFYGGKMFVFENFPGEKAKDLVEFARKGSRPASYNSPYIPVSSSTQTQIQIQTQKPTQPTTSDLPLMRKASLHRFLAKRKDRISEKAPYQVIDSPMEPSVKKEKNESWIGSVPNFAKSYDIAQ